MLFFRLDTNFNNSIRLLDGEISHLKSFRVFSEDKTIEFRNGKGISYFYFIPANKKEGTLESQKTHNINEPSIEIATAIPQSGRLEFLLQKATELGITRFYFINFFHSDRKEINLDRCNKILLESCAQSKRHTIPEIKVVKNLEDFIINHTNCIYLDPYSPISISQNDKWDSIPIIGPEGGFRKEEIDLLQKRNCNGYHIGNNILKIETAGLFFCSLMRAKYL